MFRTVPKFSEKQKGVMNVKKTIEKHYRFDCSTDNMLQELLERKESKVSESEYVRELIRREYSASIGIDPSDLVVIKRQLIGIGRNINQIAHCFNAGQYGVVDLSRLDQPLADVTAMKQAVEDMQIIFYNGCIKKR